VACSPRNSKNWFKNVKGMTGRESAPWRGSARAWISAGSRLIPETNHFMSDKCFVDTNILVYAHDFGTGAKHERARALIEGLWSSGGGVVSTQVLQELCVSLRRKATRPFGCGATVLDSEDLGEGQTYGTVSGRASVALRWKLKNGMTAAAHRKRDPQNALFGSATGASRKRTIPRGTDLSTAGKYLITQNFN
jgi:PIN domain